MNSRHSSRLDRISVKPSVMEGGAGPRPQATQAANVRQDRGQRRRAFPDAAEGRLARGVEGHVDVGDARSGKALGSVAIQVDAVRVDAERDVEPDREPKGGFWSGIRAGRPPGRSRATIEKPASSASRRHTRDSRLPTWLADKPSLA